ncbi:MAG: hypothetical protein QOG98_2095 [Pseudonocardiales bacterium]|nr:hypothetical protein [Pseudonocardiales bacterium]
MTAPAFCTILARNYLSKALTLSDSLRRHGSDTPLVVFLTDATAETELPEITGVRWMHPGSLDLPERTMLDLAMSYDLVEFATALKPLVLQSLLEEYEQVAYLDPDTYVTSPMLELGPALDAGAGIVLTPHFLEPTPAGQQFSEGHLLNVGVYNLGFCAVNRNAKEFLTWWWGHLSTECLHDPIAGLFVDQKWVDLGSVLFGATSLRHYGYNVGVGNLHERTVSRDADGYCIATTGDRLRLFHFHAFDPSRPDELSTRFTGSTAHLRADNAAVDDLCREYAAAVIANTERIGPQPDYIYGSDTTGRRITRRMRHAHRVAVLAEPGQVPSPFVADEAAEYEQWRRRSWRLAGRLMLSDVAKGVRCALPEEYESIKRRLPGLTRSLRGRYIEKSGKWG